MGRDVKMWEETGRCESGWDNGWSYVITVKLATHN